MTNEKSDGLGRRGFLKQAASVAGAAPLGPALLSTAAAAAETSSATPKDKQETAQKSDRETERLAAYAAALRYEDIPAAVLQRAKDCIIDAVATISYGAELPWSRMVIAYAQRTGSGGKSAILGTGVASVSMADMLWSESRTVKFRASTKRDC